MQSVKILKTKLQKIIKTNRDNHSSVYEKAFEGYRLECIKILEANLTNLKNGKKVVVAFYEQAPQDHTKDYDVVLKMLDLSEDSVIELTQQEFQQYVNDEWTWKQHWATSNSKYMS